MNFVSYWLFCDCKLCSSTLHRLHPLVQCVFVTSKWFLTVQISFGSKRTRIIWSWYGPWLRAQPICLLVIGGLVLLLWWCCHCGNAPRFNWLWWFDRSVNHPDWPMNCQNVAKSNCRGWLTALLSLRSKTLSALRNIFYIVCWIVRYRFFRFSCHFVSHTATRNNGRHQQ